MESESGKMNEKKEDAAYADDVSYVYTVVSEDFKTGVQGKRTKKYYSSKPDLKIGGLYMHLGKGYPGCQRILGMEEKHYPVYYHPQVAKNEEKKDSVMEKLSGNKKNLDSKSAEQENMQHRDKGENYIR